MLNNTKKTSRLLKPDKNKMKILYRFIIVIFFISCSGRISETVTEETIKGHKEIEKINWLIGHWCNNSSNGNLVETWEKKNDSTLMGRSFFINSLNDTLSSETVSLEQRGKQPPFRGFTRIAAVPQCALEYTFTPFTRQPRFNRL